MFVCLFVFFCFIIISFGVRQCIVHDLVRHVSLFFLMFCFFSLCCLLYYLSNHLQGRVHDSALMGGHDSDSTVGPGYFLSTRRCFLCSSFDFFGVFASLLLRFLPIYFLFFCVFFFSLDFILCFIFLFVFLSLSFFSFSVSRGSWRIYVVFVIAQHNDMALYYCCLQRSGLCRSFVTTELASL